MDECAVLRTAQHTAHAVSPGAHLLLLSVVTLVLSGVLAGGSVGRRCVKGEHKRWMFSISIGDNPPFSSFHWLSPSQAPVLNTWSPAGALSWGYDG